jgi:signal transduction histidine kinase
MDEDRPLTILLLTPTGRDAKLIRDLLEREQVECRPVSSIDPLMDQLHDGFRAGAVIVAQEALRPESAHDFAQLLGRQPAWSDIPVFVLSRGTEAPEWLRPLLGRRSIDLFYRPLHPETLSTATQSALELRRRQYEVRDLLNESQRLNKRLRQRARQLRRLSLQLADAEERERRRLAVYVHDDLQQILAGTMFHLDVTERKLHDPEALRGSLATVRGLLSDAIDGTRDLSQELSPTALRRSGLVAALEWLSDHVQKLHGLAVDVEVSVADEPEEQSTSTFLFRAAQELLLNVVKHAESDRALIRLHDGGERLELTVQDYGRGFRPGDHDGMEEGSSFGLFSIRERAELLGGTVHVESTPGAGSAVHLYLPGSVLSHRRAKPQPERAPSKVSATASAVRPDGERRVRVVLVDDHTVVRSGLKLVLVEHPEIDVVDELGDGLQAVEAANTIHPDLMLMDVAMPKMDGIEATRTIKTQHPEIRIIGLSMFNDPDTAQRMLEAGAELYLPKAGPSEDLVAAILRTAP